MYSYKYENCRRCTFWLHTVCSASFVCVCVCVCFVGLCGLSSIHCETLLVFSVFSKYLYWYIFSSSIYIFVVYMYCHKISLLCLQQRWQSILMSMSVCVSVCVCLSVCEHISQTTWAVFTNFVHVAYHHGLVLLWQGDAIPRGRVKFKGFLSGWKCIIWAI